MSVPTIIEDVGVPIIVVLAIGVVVVMRKFQDPSAESAILEEDGSEILGEDAQPILEES